ncbi:F-box/kelch-repeat protein At3g23880-like [Apium graveolens]|uniref:F-box/kelch-repeat protein At3g23880-like n=1 Tax=Apium graveolens TaxID=4045 RepID=UPI003D7A9A89
MNSMATHDTRTNPNLPDDIIYLILSRLPVKSLLRFKTACKTWLSLISSRDFIKTHLFVSNNDPYYTHTHLLLRQWTFNFSYDFRTCSVHSLINEPYTKNMVNESGARTFKLNDIPSGNHSYVVGCCNGLICLANNCEDKVIFLWNPSTRKSRILPEFDDLKFSSTKFGFCYDESNDDYKVFAIFDCYLGYKCKVAVYSSKSDVWRMIGDFHIGGVSYDGVKFANRAIHWVVRRSEHVESKIILSIDIQTETFREVLLPGYEAGTVFIKLDTFGEKLIILTKYEKIRYTFWVLEKYGAEECWRELFTIPLEENGFLTLRTLLHQSPRLICILVNGDVLLSLNSTIIYYNTKYNTYKELLGFRFGALEVCTYVESLVSPHL